MLAPAVFRFRAPFRANDSLQPYATCALLPTRRYRPDLSDSPRWARGGPAQAFRNAGPVRRRCRATRSRLPHTSLLHQRRRLPREVSR